MDKQQERPHPGQGSTETRYQKEPENKQGTMGGQPPLKAPAGIQKPGPGGVLTEKGAVRKER